MASGQVVLHWLPLGAGGRLVRHCGAAWERVQARRDGRRPQPLFHAALEVTVDGVKSTIEIGPVVNSLPASHGVVMTGPVGAAWAGRYRIFRYELRCWRDGSIPDLGFEPTPPVELSRSGEVAGGILEMAPRVPDLTWGRDESGLGEMWNSNSVIAWLLTKAGTRTEGLRPPAGGRAPGWNAGIELAGSED